jgi:hypothetical protein
VAHQQAQDVEDGLQELGGSCWASSRISTLPARLCSLRQREVRAANRDSNSWTLVVTTSGASQFSQARREARFRRRALSAWLWCSTTVAAKRGEDPRNTSAVCSMMLV